jgi:hypothetical protein
MKKRFRQRINLQTKKNRYASFFLAVGEKSVTPKPFVHSLSSSPCFEFLLLFGLIFLRVTVIEVTLIYMPNGSKTD